MPPPSGATYLFDATVAANIQAGGIGATDGILIDTWIATQGGISATQGTVGAQPYYDTLGCNGPGIGFGRLGLPVTATFLSLPSVAYTFPLTIACVFRADGRIGQTSTSPGVGVIPIGAVAELSADVTAGRGMLLTNSSAWALRCNGAGGTQNADTAAGQFWATDDAVRLAIVTIDGATMTMRLNGVNMPLAISGTAPGASGFSVAGTLGALHGGSMPLVGMLGLFGVWPRAFSGADIAQLEAYVAANWTLAIPNQAQVDATQGWGDSIMLGATTDISGNQYEWPRSHVGRATAGLGFRFGSYLNGGSSGATIPVITANFDAQGAPALVSGIKNIVFCEGGINDIPTFTITNSGQATAAANTMLTRMQTFVTGHVIPALAALSATGRPHHVFVETVTLGGAGFTSLQDSARQQYNALVLAAAPGWSTAQVTVHTVDPGGDLILGTQAGTPPGVTGAQNVNFFTDIHPARSGQRRYGAIALNALAAAGL
jgi:hypothetical protein